MKKYLLIIGENSCISVRSKKCNHTIHIFFWKKLDYPKPMLRGYRGIKNILGFGVRLFIILFILLYFWTLSHLKVTNLPSGHPNRAWSSDQPAFWQSSGAQTLTKREVLEVLEISFINTLYLAYFRSSVNQFCSHQIVKLSIISTESMSLRALDFI